MNITLKFKIVYSNLNLTLWFGSDDQIEVILYDFYIDWM